MAYWRSSQRKPIRGIAGGTDGYSDVAHTGAGLTQGNFV